MDTRRVVLEAIESCFRDDGIIFSTSMLARPLMELGVDSLTYAIIVARLERELSFDPFTANPELPYPTTLEDFIQAYLPSKSE